jgi:alpha-ribazole phosphatase
MMNTHTRVYLIRHGQVANHASGVYNGHNDVPLSRLGMSQMESIAERLKEEKLAAVYSSDLLRSRWGGEALARIQGCVLHSEPALREVDFGLWTGLTFMEIEEHYPGALEDRWRSLLHYRPPGGESVDDLRRRVLPAIHSIIDEHRGASVAMVLHGGVNRVILADAMGLDGANLFSIDQDFGCVNIIDCYQEHAVVRLINGRTEIGKW